MQQKPAAELLKPATTYVVDIADWTKRAPSLVLRVYKPGELDSKWKFFNAYEPRFSLSKQPLVMESVALFVYP